MCVVCCISHFVTHIGIGYIYIIIIKSVSVHNAFVHITVCTTTVPHLLKILVFSHPIAQLLLFSSSGTEIIAKLKKKEVEKKETEEVDEED